MICIDNKVIVKEEIKNINNKRKWTEKLIHRPCPLCGQSNYVIISRKMKDGINFPTVICKNCTLVYTNPIPAEEIYNRFYLEAYNDFYFHQDKFIPSSKVLPGDVNEILKIIQSHLTDNKSKILEIGSGSGRLLYYLSEKYANVQGIEPGSNAKYAREILNH